MPPTEPLETVPFDANLRRLEGKKGLVIGIANQHSIAYGCAKAFRSFGAELAITYLNEKAKPYVEPLAGTLEAPILMPAALALFAILSVTTLASYRVAVERFALEPWLERHREVFERLAPR